MEIIQSVQNRIYLIRGQRVILDKDIAFLYETETKVLNQAVNRNIKRFPLDFMFQLTKEEVDLLRLQKNQDNEVIPNLRSQIVTSSLESWGGNRYLPNAFTEQGVAMLSGIVNSDKAIQMNIAIMRAFVELRRVLLIKSDFKLQLDLIKDRLSGYDAQLNQIYDVIENIMDETAAKNKWDNRTRIGFTKGDNA
ncbi:MAG: hypothetical protein RLZZ424_1206 [Bacteroidota bacterium]|jgi:uncharacterized membrane protein YukC